MTVTKGRIFLGACFCVGMVRADVVFTKGNHPQPDEQNILLKSGATGTQVTGSISGFPTVVVDFTSNQTELEPSLGQARVTASPDHTPLKDITISLENGLTYSDLIFNPFNGEICRDCKSGMATVTVDAVDSMGNAEAPQVFTYKVDKTGNHFLTITTTNGERIVSTNISDPSGFDDLRQPRISGLVVPEPSTYAPLMGLAVGSIVFFRRGRKALGKS